MKNIENKPENGLKGDKAKGFADIAATIFAPIYPVIADQIITSTGIREGTALDVGSGPGHLATALASASSLTVHALDLSPDMIQICEARLIENGLCGRVIPVQGDVSSIPFDDETFDLVVSRGSWFFWEDLTQGLTEIYRVLKPGGKTYIGGGFGNASLKKQIVSAMKDRSPDFEEGMKERITSRSPEIVTAALDAAGVLDYTIISDESGFWIKMVR
jgi:SAM-dependent methyltransferase